MRFLLRLFLLVALVVGVFWFARNFDFDRSGVRAAEGRLEGAAKKVDAAVSDLDLDKIAEELKSTGRVIRRRAGEAAREVADVTKDGRTTAAIKAKLALDPSLSALQVSVDTTEGRVTLAGTVASAADVARAIEIAFEQDDVYEVISTLQVRPPQAGSGGR